MLGRSVIDSKYIERCSNYSDIYEHLPTLARYASECSHITEMGVRCVVSSYAFAHALKNKKSNKIVQVDLYQHPNITTFKNECSNENINVTFHQASSLDCPLEQTDLLFIDTWHVYGMLKRELERWNTYVGKYIIMHDTTVDEWAGETIRLKWNPKEQSEKTGIPIHEITKGLWPAIREFLASHPEWTMRERYNNNNGLTILERV
jgi:cephalosporin hydroxylase